MTESVHKPRIRVKKQQPENHLKTFKWKGFTWQFQEDWGMIHPKKPLFWYDETAVKIDRANRLHLLTHSNPRFFEEITAMSPIGAGLVCCNHPFHFGYYRFTFCLPEGPFLFPAIWLYDLKTWPPEIDLLEGYSNKNGNYKALDFILKRSIHKLWSTFHYTDESGKHIQLPRTPLFQCKSPLNKFFNLDLYWTRRDILIYLDDKLVRTLRGDVMKYFQQPMKLIMNNGVHKLSGYDFTSDFVISQFHYKPF